MDNHQGQQQGSPRRRGLRWRRCHPNRLHIPLLMLLAVGGGVARADCFAPEEPFWECDVNTCILTGFPDEVSGLVDQQTNQAVAVELLELDSGTQLVRPATPLTDGQVLLAGSREVRVALRPTGAPTQNIVGQYVRGSFECWDSFPRLPKLVIKNEEFFLVTVDLGRPPLRGARADIWVLKPEDAVPVGNASAFSVVTPEPFARRISNGGEATASSRPPGDFSILLHRTNIKGADRVAVQLVEPSGFMTGVLVVPVDDQEIYVGCTCNDAGASHPVGWLVALGTFLAARRFRKTSAAHRPGFA